MKKALLYGAGNIGRGFLGQLFYQSGYELVFIDIDEQIVNGLNHRGSYPIKVVSNDEQYEVMIHNARAVDGRDKMKVAEEIAGCDILCSAVGVNVLPRIIENLCEGIKLRAKADKVLNIIICENLMEADKYIKSLILEHIESEYRAYVETKVGFVEASVGRMVPVMTEEMKQNDPLLLCVEPFCTLPVDKEAFRGEVLKVQGVMPETGFSYYIQSKLFLHNMGHALCAYFGRLAGYEYIYEAISDPQIKKLVKEAMTASAKALSMEHGRSLKEVLQYADDLMQRFGNRYLQDTVQRVGRDLKRKLAKNDRLVGAVLLCQKHGIDPSAIKKGIAAALLFGEAFDAATLAVSMEGIAL